MRDDQQKKVYAWEDGWLDWNRATASKAFLRKLVRRAERMYRVRPVTAIFFPKRNRGATPDKRTPGLGRRLPTEYSPWEHDIRIRPRHRNPAVALHEAAHAIHDELFGPVSTEQLQAHGPIWMGIYLNLLIAAKVAPEKALLASARAAGIKWAALARTHPKAIRRAYRRLHLQGRAKHVALKYLHRR